ncbi:MAG: MBL fold metallo-hydrolase [Deltaproteobacteria bacterium]|nr:MBL fold metallo-hydrolase [Deltaproteobacteria bacterium]
MSWTLDLFRADVRFAVLGSGSRGNASVVWSGDTAVLVDCGLPARRTLSDLRAVGVEPSKVKGIFLTHEHGDHVGGAEAVARKLDIPVFASDGTRAALRIGGDVRIERVRSGETLRIGALDVEPFRVPHDVAEPLGFVVGAGVHRVGFATDMGSVHASVARKLRTCRAVLLEFNHDEHMLRFGEYPPSLKDRVSSDLGHLSNRQGADLLSRLAGSRVEHVLLGHLSMQNNRRDLALGAATAALEGADFEASLAIADQESPTDVLHLHDGPRR